MNQFSNLEDSKNNFVSKAGERLKVAVLFKTLGEIGSRLLGFVFIMIMSRKLGPEGWGLWYHSLAFVAYLGFILDPGFSMVLTQRIAGNTKDETDAHKNNLEMLPHAIFSYRMITFVALGILFCSSYFFWPYTNDEDFWFVLAAYGFITANLFIDFFVHYQDGLHRHHIGAKFRFFWRLCLLGGALACYFLTDSKTTAIMLFGFSSWISVLYGFYFFRFRMLNFKEIFTCLYPILKPALLVGLNFLLAITYLRIDVLLLEHFKFSEFDIGLYSSGLRYLEMMAIFPSIIVLASYPTLSEFYTRLAKETLQAENNKLGKEHPFLLSMSNVLKPIILATISISLGIQACTILFKYPIIMALFGKNFSGSELYFNIVAPVLFTQGLVGLFNYCLMANNQFKETFYLNFIGAFFNIVLNLIFIPRYGITAAAITTAATGFIMLSFGYFLCLLPGVPKRIFAGSALISLFAWGLFWSSERLPYAYEIFAGIAVIVASAVGIRALLKIRKNLPTPS